jgi:hypothetical protein
MLCDVKVFGIIHLLVAGVVVESLCKIGVAICEVLASPTYFEYTVRSLFC